MVPLKPLGDIVWIPALMWIGFILAVTYWVFNVGGSWCATMHPVHGVMPVDLGVLKNKLMELNFANAPFHLYDRKGGKQLCSEWNIKSVVWTELFAKAGVTEQHRIVMEFDEITKTVRAVDTSSTINWRAGFSLSLDLGYFRGIDFFQYSALKTYGLVRSVDGWKIEGDYVYRFDRSEMKSPIVQCITECGWTYKPVLFLGGPLSIGT